MPRTALESNIVNEVCAEIYRSVIHPKLMILGKENVSSNCPVNKELL